MAASRNATLSDGPLGRLLAATKLGTERKHLLRWLAAPPPLILRPRTLLFGVTLFISARCGASSGRG